MAAEPGLPNNVGLVDLRMLGLATLNAAYVLLGDEPALVDPGPTSTLDHLEAGLKELGLAFSEVRALLLTHIHLDHAGATGTLVARYPHLQVYVHQRGAPHMAAPERLLRSAGRLYGDALTWLWGEVRPVPKAHLIPLSGGETVHVGGRPLRVFDTPGHARHHVTYLDETEGVAFVGDVAGVRLPGVSYVRPPTPPPEVDLEAWQETLNLLGRLKPDQLLLFHFGPVADPPEHIEQLRARLLRWADIVREGLASGEDEPAQIARLRRVAEEELSAVADAGTRASYDLVTPIEQSWQGLARYWRKRGI